jgi:hypothetical protein
MLKVKPGDKVRLTLLSTKTDLATRVARGLTSLVYEGVASADLKLGERFWLPTLPDIGELATSPVTFIGDHFFTTTRSTYLVEFI